MNEAVGDKIKKMRKLAGVSQKLLAQDICTQSEISRIENNQYKPTYYILMKISERLGVDINYFLEEESGDRSDYIKDVKDQLYKARRDREYQTIYDIVKTELKNPLFKEGENRNYLMWNKGLALYHLLNKKEEAIQTLLSCLSNKSMDKLYTELDMNILGSLGIIYRNEKQLEKALEYMLRAYEITEKVNNAIDIKQVLKVYYNLSKIYTDLGRNIEESIRLCKKGIQKCHDSESLFLLSEFNYQIGRNYLLYRDANSDEELRKSAKGLEFWENTMRLDALQGKFKLVEHVRNEFEVYIKTGEVI